MVCNISCPALRHLQALQAEFLHLIGPSIPLIIDLLKYDNSEVHPEGAKLLLMLSTQGI